MALTIALILIVGAIFATAATTMKISDDEQIFGDTNRIDPNNEEQMKYLSELEINY